VFFFKAFNRQPAIDVRLERSDRVESALRNIHRDCQDLNMLIVILPEMSGSYGTFLDIQKPLSFIFAICAIAVNFDFQCVGKIKKVCETELGIVSQCCLPKNVMKGNKQYLENVALKINVKVYPKLQSNRLNLVFLYSYCYVDKYDYCFYS
jgi:eukaryotic translation initiation factor 2C